ncbi:unnamed protein product [Arabidopsis halleri]
MMKMKQIVSSNSEAQSYNESPHSPLRFLLHYQMLEIYRRAITFLLRNLRSKSRIPSQRSYDGNKFTHFLPLYSPISPPPPQFPPPRHQRTARIPMNSSSDKVSVGDSCLITASGDQTDLINLLFQNEPDVARFYLLLSLNSSILVLYPILSANGSCFQAASSSITFVLYLKDEITIATAGAPDKPLCFTLTLL